jgi:hypothetical protein
MQFFKKFPPAREGAWGRFCTSVKKSRIDNKVGNLELIVLTTRPGNEDGSDSEDDNDDLSNVQWQLSTRNQLWVFRLLEHGVLKQQLEHIRWYWIKKRRMIVNEVN